MKIVQEIKITDRKSLNMVKQHYAAQCTKSRSSMKTLYATFFEKWTFERLSLSAISAISSEWIGEALTNSVQKFQDKISSQEGILNLAFQWIGNFIPSILQRFKSSET